MTGTQARASNQLPLVVVVILNWNNAADTLACLESVFRLDYPNFSVLVVDNGSTDDSVAQMNANYPDLELIETGMNLGYAEGNNVGIRKALESDADYFCVLNNDTEVTSDFLWRLVDAMEEHKTAGIVGPKVFFYESREILYSAGCTIDWSRGVVNHRGFGQHEEEFELHVPARAQNVDALTGCGVLVRRQAVQVVGLLDPTYFLNYEDIDWCMRMSAGGYKVRYVPDAILYHKVSATLGQDSPGNAYYMTRNALKFFARYGPHKQRALVSIISRTLRTICVWTLKPTYHSAVYRERRNAVILGIRDFVEGKNGPMATSVVTEESTGVVRVQ